MEITSSLSASKVEHRLLESSQGWLVGAPIAPKGSSLVFFSDVWYWKGPYQTWSNKSMLLHGLEITARTFSSRGGMQAAACCSEVTWQSPVRPRGNFQCILWGCGTLDGVLPVLEQCTKASLWKGNFCAHFWFMRWNAGCYFPLGGCWAGPKYACRDLPAHPLVMWDFGWGFISLGARHQNFPMG